MAPAVLRRLETSYGTGWGSYGSLKLDCWAMPGIYEDDPDLRMVNNRRFAWTGESYERWVTEGDRRKLHAQGFKLKTFYCPPGTFHIANEQALFDKNAAVVVAEESLI